MIFLQKMLLAGMLIFCAVLLSPVAGWSHPPSSILLAYEKTEGVLSITARHSVSDPKTHFIKEFSVFVNGEKVHTITASNQKDEKEAEETCAVGKLFKGTVVEVEALCNKFGKMKEKIIIE